MDAGRYVYQRSSEPTIQRSPSLAGVLCTAGTYLRSPQVGGGPDRGLPVRHLLGLTGLPLLSTATAEEAHPAVKAEMCDRRAQCEYCAKSLRGLVLNTSPHAFAHRRVLSKGIGILSHLRKGDRRVTRPRGGAVRSRSRRAATARGCRRQVASPADQRAAPTKGVEAEGKLHDGRRW